MRSMSHRQHELLRALAEAACHQRDNRAGKEYANGGNRQQDAKQGAAGVAQQIFQLLRVFGAGSGKNRHEGVGKTALGEEAAQGVGNAQRGVESIGHHDVKIARDQHVAQQPRTRESSVITAKTAEERPSEAISTSPDAYTIRR